METDSSSLEDPTAILQRARLLMDQRRYADAAEWFQRLLAISPHDAYVLAQLAVCWCHVPGKEGQSVQVARHAVAAAPDQSYFHAVLALTLVESAKVGQNAVLNEALESASKARELDPDSSFAHGLRALALLRLHRFPEAEVSARRALALDTESTMAAQVLSVALLNQKKDEDLNSLVDWQLAENPDDSGAHVSAGYRDLMKGAHKEACGHFREALRLNPNHEGARQGLIESFRARSWFYRLYVRFSYFMSQFGQRGAGGIIFLGFVVYRVAFESLRTSHPVIAYSLAGVWMTFALWSFLARGIGSALMLTDRFVRMAVSRKEYWEGVCVGTAVLLAITFLTLGLWNQWPDFIYSALAFALSSVPIASAFSNDHYTGRWLYLALAVVSGSAALILAVGTILQDEVLAGIQIFQTAIYSGIACTWLRFLGVMYR